MLQSLTNYEYKGMKAECSFADGHAYHELSPCYAHVIQKFPELWSVAHAKKVTLCEEEFKSAWAQLVQSSFLEQHPHIRICPSASNSIDIVGAYLHEKKFKTLLIEPTFDNLYLILKRRKCAVKPIKEENLFQALDENDINNYLSSFQFDALFLVNPNNPTGIPLPAQYIKKIAEYCADHKKLLILDCAFRLYNKHSFDDYKMIHETGVNYIFIEDTGKTWPTHDMKASMLIFSAGISSLLNTIYDEIYLCHSRFILQMFTEIFTITKENGIHSCIQFPMTERKQRFNSVLHGSPFKIISQSSEAVMPVEWIDISTSKMNDIQAEQYLRQQGLHCLPGRYFYWSENHHDFETHKIRFALGRPKKVFERGLAILEGLFP